MFVVIRFRQPEDGPSSTSSLGEDLRVALSVLAARPGYEGGEVGRNLDDPTLWSLVTRWRDVGSYRRALSSYEVKLHAVPLLSGALDEPSAYEAADGPLNVAGTRGE